MKRMKWIASGLLICVLVLSACSPQNTAVVQNAATDALAVTVSILPQKYFVERIGGEHVVVNVMVAPGDSPASYEPKPEQMAALSDSAAYYSIGVPFESAWLEKIAAANENMLMVDMIENIERMPMDAHSNDEDPAQESLDPHVWASPELVKVMSQTIYQALVELDPKNQADYKANLEGFIAEIDVLEADITASLAGLEGKKFFVFHPSWGYFAKDFGLEQIPIEIGGTEPSASELAGLIEEARAEGAKVIFVQPEFSTRTAETIATEIGGSVVLISSLEYDWIENLRKVAAAFKDVLSQQGT